MSNNDKKISDDDIVKAMKSKMKGSSTGAIKHPGEIGGEPGKGVEGKIKDKDIASIVKKEKLPSESLKELNELVKKKRVDQPVDLFTERDEFGRIKFIIKEKSEEEEPDLEIERNEFNQPIFILKDKVKDKIKTTEKVNLQEGTETVITDEFLGGNFNEAVILPDDDIIKNVCLISKESKNNRIYSDEALRTISEKAENVKVFLNHPEVGEKYRKVEKLLGQIKNSTKQGEKVYGDLHLLKHQNFVLNIARQMPEIGIGFSIAAEGKTETLSDGKMNVVDITNLSSIDLVVSPATTKSLFDGKIEEEFESKVQCCEFFKTEACGGKMLANWALCQNLGSGSGFCPYIDESTGYEL